MNIKNFWKETGDVEIDRLNIIKTWLCGGSDGQTYPLTDEFLTFDVDKIEKDGFEYVFPEDAFDKIVGFKYNYRVDDEDLDKVAKEIYKGLEILNYEVAMYPERFFNKKQNKNGCECNAFKGISCEYCVGEENICTCDHICPFKD